MSYVFQPPLPVSVPISNSGDQFPVHRIYCVGRNYEEHAKEMGYTGREPPFFFLKPADALLYVAPGETGVLPYPSLTSNFHHEVELVVAIGRAGKSIAAQDAMQYVYGYALGLDMTRRDLQNDMKKQGRPWCIGKAFDHSAPMGAITPAPDLPRINQASIELLVDGVVRQSSSIERLIWSIPEIIEHLSAAWQLEPGDLIFSGTPEGVAAVERGNTMTAKLTGLPDLQVRVA